MESERQALWVSPAALVIMGGYLALLIALGWWGRRARRDGGLADFYLGGRDLGLVVLLLTLFATQYSGNTLLGFAGSGYRQGFRFLVSVPFMMGVIGVFLVMAPRLYPLSREHGFLTPADYFLHRYGNRFLAVGVSVSGIIALANYILTNLKAMGQAAATLSGGRVTPADAIIVLALVIVVYETLGGLRSVAWTDVMQGICLLAGCLVLSACIVVAAGGLPAILQQVREARPDFWDPLSGLDIRTWTSTLVVVSLGIALYPHAIQRIYAARDAATLRRAYQFMAVLPLVTTLLMVLVGIAGAGLVPGLDRAGSETVPLRLLELYQDTLPGSRWILILFVTAVFAAIMSTVDSALLSVSAMIIQDLFRPLFPDLVEERLTRVGKGLSWALMALMIPLAIGLPQTIWRLIEIKLELLVQVSPGLLLGLHWRSLQGKSVLTGFLCGTALTLFLTVGHWVETGIPNKPWGLHAGLWGLGLNLAVLFLLHGRSIQATK